MGPRVEGGARERREPLSHHSPYNPTPRRRRRAHSCLPCILSSPPCQLQHVRVSDSTDAWLPLVAWRRQRIVTTLGECGYSLEEFLLDPRQIGLPNARLRYYLLATRHLCAIRQVWVAVCYTSTWSVTHRTHCQLSDYTRH